MFRLGSAWEERGKRGPVGLGQIKVGNHGEKHSEQEQ
jgi:hypothetical protein